MCVQVCVVYQGEVKCVREAFVMYFKQSSEFCYYPEMWNCLAYAGDGEFINHC